MENVKPRYGVLLFETKDKDKKKRYAIGCTSGTEFVKPKYSEQQITSLFEFLNHGESPDMFKSLTVEDYRTFIEMHYNSLAREATSEEEMASFEMALVDKIAELEEAYQNSQASELDVNEKGSY